ncbi:very short patch repair endonuclease [Parabacteroides sp. ASD2025]|jgi:DNA mismatch endonuclease (patch repair protein)|uniref:very short patch repair endonuclease n=1 Tax=Parabacteroides sp. ASD2025 TaxID=3415987 RepID=UPI00306EB58A
MSRISGNNTKPEILVRKYLFSHGFRYRKNKKELPGKPDIVLSKYHVIIFINGCFWHGHTCRAGRLPETNHAFWENKIHKNILRDKKNIQELETRGWKVIVIWECELKNTTLQNNRLTLLISEIKSNLA